MEIFQVPGIFKSNICRAQELETNLYEIFKDNNVIGTIFKEDGGWRIEDYKSESLTAENVQLIGQQIDKRNRK